MPFLIGDPMLVGLVGDVPPRSGKAHFARFYRDRFKRPRWMWLRRVLAGRLLAP